MRCTEGLGVASVLGPRGCPLPDQGRQDASRVSSLGGALSYALRLLGCVLDLGEPGRLGTGHGRRLPATPQEVLFREKPPLPPMTRFSEASGQGEGTLCSYTLPAIALQSSLHDSG